MTVAYGTGARCKGHSESEIALVQDLHDDMSRIGNAVSPKSRDGFSGSFEPATDSNSAHISHCYSLTRAQVMRFQSRCRLERPHTAAGGGCSRRPARAENPPRTWETAVTISGSGILLCHVTARHGIEPTIEENRRGSQGIENQPCRRPSLQLMDWARRRGSSGGARSRTLRLMCSRRRTSPTRSVAEKSETPRVGPPANRA